MKGSEWTISDSNGMAHKLGIRGTNITVDSNTYKVKSSNWLINVIDYSVDFPGANCHIVAIGNKARLAVNGVYNDDGTPYEPVAGIPAWIWVLVALSILGGWFFGGLLCAAIGVAFSTMYVSAALNKNNKKVFISFAIFVVIALAFLALNVFVLAPAANM